MPYYGDGAPYYYGGAFANHSSLMTGVGRSYHNPIAARYSPHLSTISESPLVVSLRRYTPVIPTTTTASIARPRRIIDTADIDVTKKPRTLAQDNRQQRHRLRRDRPTIKIRSQALKDNPALREYNERHEKTVGELLVEKFLIKDKQQEEGERKMKLYHQASLMIDREQSPTLKEHENDLLAAIRRRVTRRMTRRRSSADVIPLNPEQIEREAAYHAAQAVALDNLVAEEQAEIEVEMRRGTFAKRQAMRLPLEASEASESEDDEMDEEERLSKTKKHPTTKKKKRRKLAEKPKSEDEDEGEEYNLAESVIEEEEFEWDDRVKCDDIAVIVPKDERTGKREKVDEKVTKSKTVDKPSAKVAKVESKPLPKLDTVSKKDTRPISPKPEPKDTKPKEKKEEEKVKVQEKKKEDPKLTDKKPPNIQRSKSPIDSVPRFKIEACNSVGDFSTLYIKAATSPEATSPRTIEQFRESIRLPAPRLTSIETEVVLPVRKPYVRDTSRNSVYLALKQPAGGIGADEPAQIIDAETRKESDTSRPANKSRGGDRSPIGRDGLSQSAQKSANDESAGTYGKLEKVLHESKKPSLLKGGREEFVSWWDETEEEEQAKPDDKIGKLEEKLVETKKAETEKKAKDKLEIGSKLREKSKSPVPIEKKESVDKVKDKVEPASKVSEKAVIEKKDKEPADKVKDKAETVSTGKISDLRSKAEPAVEPAKKVEDSKDKVKDKTEAVTTGKISDLHTKSKPAVDKSAEKGKDKIEAVSANKTSDLQSKVKPAVEKVPDKPKDKIETVPTSKVSEPSNKSKLPIKVVDESVKSVTSEAKDKSTDKVTDTKDKVSVPSKDVKPAEKPKAPTETQKKAAPTDKAKSPETTSALPPSKVEPISLTKDKKPINNEAPKPARKITDRHLPNIPEEPKSASPTERTKPLLFGKKETQQQQQQSLIKPPNIASPGKDERKKKVDAEAVMKIEKKILEDADKILSGPMMPPPGGIIDASALTKKEEKQSKAAPSLHSAKVGPQQQQQATKKKSSEPPPQQQPPAAAAAVPEIDFWSEIRAQEGSAGPVSGKVQSPRIDEREQQARKSPEPLRLDLSAVHRVTSPEDGLKTPLVLEPEELKTPLILEPATPLPENLDQVPLINLQLTQDRPAVVCNGSAQVEKEKVQKKEEEQARESVKEDELSGTVKKISKWTNRDNLSSLNEADGDVTPVASKEASPLQSAQSSTTTKKKVVKKKKSTTGGTKKKATDDSTKSKTSGKKVTKKAAASPQASQAKTPMSASGSPRNLPSQRPAELSKLFYTTPAILLTATPRDLRKVRRAKVKRKKPATRTPSLSSDSTGSTRSTATTSTEEGSNCEEDAEQKRLASTRSNDSGFDGSPRLSNCDMVCHKKCEKLTGNLCGLNQKLLAEALQASKKGPTYMRTGRKSFVRRRLMPYQFIADAQPPPTPSQSSENQRTVDGEHYQHSGRITPPATNLPRFKKYEVTDFNFLKVLGKGSFGKVLLAELRGTECVYAVKCLKKDVVLEDDDVECTLIERKVLTLATRHPYLCHLFCTFQTESHLFFVMEYLNGGDLMFHIQKSGRFAEPRAKFYAAEIWSGLIFLHKKGIVYRDLKLDNVLLDFEGHIRIADFGMCKLQIFLDRTADTFCGTPDYMAPEIIKGLKYNQAVDWWSYGVLLYEMLTGQSPFSGCDEDELFWSICNERPFIPRYLGQSATDLLVCLLEKDSGKRIPGHEIACHPFFCTIAWDKLERRTLEPPFKPAVEHTLDTRYFDTAFTTERPRLTPVPEQILTSMDQGVFRGFSYTNPNATD